MVNGETPSLGRVLTEYALSALANAEGQRHPITRRGEREPIPVEVRRAVWKRDRQQCRACGMTVLPFWFAEVDHVIPWSAGGTDEMSNLRLLCRECNQDRSNFVGPLDAARQSPVRGECLVCAEASEPLPEVDERIRVWCLRCGHESLGAA